MPLTNNDTFRRLRYALDLRDPELEEIFTLGGSPMEKSAIIDLLKKETDPGYTECSDQILSTFLDGLITKRRGKKEGAPTAPAQQHPFTNNTILKKLRIALELHEEDMIAIMKKAEFDLSRSELSALFRQPGHKNYKECGDQFLRNFLTGIKDYTPLKKS